MDEMNGLGSVSSYIRVDGLKSHEGRKLNLRAGRVLRPGNREKCYVCSLDGALGIKQLQEKNLSFFQPSCFKSFLVMVNSVPGKTLAYRACVFEFDDELVGEGMGSMEIRGQHSRSMGTVHAIDAFLRNTSAARVAPGGQMVLVLPDLNVSTAINQMVTVDPTGDDPDGAAKMEKLWPRLEAVPAMSWPDGMSQSDFVESVNVHKHPEFFFFGPLAKLKKRFHRFMGKRGTAGILAVYEPPSPKPDPKHEQGETRLAAVLAGTYHIYPCPHPEHAEELEVRYVDAASARPSSEPETFYDYGLAEALAYAKFAVALDDEERLFPAVLAARDPPAFWAAMLRIDAWLAVLLELTTEDIVCEWLRLQEGAQKAQKVRAETPIGSAER